MLDSGVTAYARNSNGETPLMFATGQNYYNVVNFLSLRSENLDEEDENGMSLLMH